MNEEVVIPVLHALEALDIPYMVVGSFVVNFWGEPRSTHDADVVAVMPLESAPSLAAALQGPYYADDEFMRQSIDRQSVFNVIHIESGFKVDVWLLSDDPYRQVAFERRRREPLFEGRPETFFVATAEHHPEQTAMVSQIPIAARLQRCARCLFDTTASP